MSAFSSLSTQMIEFYDCSRDQRETFAALTKKSFGIAEHRALNMPVVIGRFKKPGKVIVAPNPDLNFHFYNNVVPVHGYGRFFRANKFRAIASTVTLKNERFSRPGDGLSAAAVAKVRSHKEIIATLLKFDQNYFPDAPFPHDIKFSCDNAIVNESSLRKRIWHTDSFVERAGVNVESKEAPVRIYTWRPNVTTECIRGEWQVQSGKLVLHPLVAELVAAEGAQHDAGPQLRASDLTKIDRLTDQLRTEGLIVQARPYEIMMMDNFTWHRSALPRKPSLSSFNHLSIMPST